MYDCVFACAFLVYVCVLRMESESESELSFLSLSNFCLCLVSESIEKKEEELVLISAWRYGSDVCVCVSTWMEDNGGGSGTVEWHKWSPFTFAWDEKDRPHAGTTTGVLVATASMKVGRSKSVPLSFDCVTAHARRTDTPTTMGRSVTAQATTATTNVFLDWKIAA